MRVRRVGRSALLIECADADEVEAWRAELWRRRAAGDLAATDIVAGAVTVLVDGVPPDAARTVEAWPAPAPVRVGNGPLIEVPTLFDGEDLPDVAARWAVSVPEVVNRLTAARLRVAFCGFAPGFPYLAGLPGEWAVPRLPSPRPRVPAGAVGLAGAYAGIYPTASPGGWRLVGRTDVPLFDVHRNPPALLAPGTRVRLVAA